MREEGSSKSRLSCFKESVYKKKYLEQSRQGGMQQVDTIMETQGKDQSKEFQQASMKIRRNQEIYVIESDDPNMKHKLQGIGKLYHIFNRRQSSIFCQLQLFSQMLRFFEQNSTIREQRMYHVSEKQKEGIQDFESIWKRKIQRHVVEAFSKISYEQKQIIERKELLQGVLESMRIEDVFGRLGRYARGRKERRVVRENQEREREKDLSQSRIIRVQAEESGRRNMSMSGNFSQIFAQFQSIPEEEDNNERLSNNLKSLSNIQSEILNIKATIDNTYNLLKVREKENQRNHLDMTTDESRLLRKRRRNKRFSFSDCSDSDEMEDKENLAWGMRTERKNKRREFERERMKYLNQNGVATKRQKYQKQVKGKGKVREQESVGEQRVRNVTHHIIQPIIHNIIQPVHQLIVHQPVYPAFSTKLINHSYSFASTQRSYPTFSNTISPRQTPATRILGNSTHRHVIERNIGYYTPKASFSFSFY